jgi:protease-4
MKEMKLISLPKDRRKVAWLLVGLLVIVGSFVNDLQHFNEPETRLPTIPGLTEEKEKFNEKLIEGNGDNKIVVLHVDGIIQEEITSSPLPVSSGVVPVIRLTKQIDQAIADNSVKAIIVAINSPGGTVTASQTIHEKLLEAKQKGKKVIILMRETAASGGYYIAAAGDKIVANASTLTGSIGVIFHSVNLEELYKKIGYNPITFKAGKYKDIGSSDRPFTDEERTIIQGLLDEEYTGFVNVVAEGRHMNNTQAADVAEGKIYSGKQAKEIGLIDELGNMPKAIEVAKKEANITEARVVEYTTSLDFVTSLLGGGLASSSLTRLLGNVEQPRLSGVLYLWQPE